MVQFCSQLSRAAGEPLAGTGAHPASNLLLSWPSAEWTRTFNLAKSMTEEEHSVIQWLASVGRRTNLIDRKSDRGSDHRVYLMPEGIQFDLPRNQLMDFFLAVGEGRSLAAWQGKPAKRPLILCCTHGKKDRCCAKFGNSTYKALVAASRQLAQPLDIWQSSHLGGCRLAASVLEFPALRKYGRIDVDQADDFVRAVDRNQPYLPCYRGHSRWTPAQQVAELASLNLLAEQGITPESLSVEQEETQGSSIQLILHWANRCQSGKIKVLLGPSEVSRFGTCGAIDEGEAPVVHPTWQVEQIERVLSAKEQTIWASAATPELRSATAVKEYHPGHGRIASGSCR